jgi:lipoprotein-releasing system ATP-binding protein
MNETFVSGHGSAVRGQGTGNREQGITARAGETVARHDAGHAVRSTQYSMLTTAASDRTSDEPDSGSCRRSAIGAPHSPLLSARGLVKSYRKGKVVIPVLKGVDLSVADGGFVAIVGQSGCGKSTLLHLLGTLDAPDAGDVCFEGRRIDNLPSRQRDIVRNQHVGMIFQFYHLLPELSTLENVLAPVMIRYGVWSYWRHKRQHTERAQTLLDLVGLGHRLTHTPRELSGGEMQRAAIARALIAQPKLLLADEPTGNLDQKTGAEILALLRKLNREQGLTIVMVTHDQAIARQAHTIVRLVEGRVAPSDKA